MQLYIVCAQAPYNMRGVFGGCMALVLMSPSIISSIEHHYTIIMGLKPLSVCLSWLAGTRGELEMRTQAFVEEVYMICYTDTFCSSSACLSIMHVDYVVKYKFVTT